MKSLRLSVAACAAGPALLALATAPATYAQSLTIDSPNVAVADPVVPRPPTAPCVVTLYTDETFAFDFSFHHYTYTPPGNCAGPWEKVVLAADVDVTAGRQFDRTVLVWLGGAVIYFGTTQEPSATVAPSFHIERDLTDYSALLNTPQDGYLILGNVVDSTYTGIYHTSATLYFYPRSGDDGSALSDDQERSRRPDQVLPLLPNNLAYLASSTDALTATFTLPTNVERAFLDVYAQSQASDEFWFFDLPNDIAATFGDSGNTAFKEAEVTIDGQPAGVAPIYPWIYTGGGDPLLWRPIPGVQTLSFDPYRVDLTPFVGLLSDGTPHSVAVSVFNAVDHFSTAASLLVYQDHGSRQVTGGVTINTLTATPPVNVIENVTTAADGTISGPVTVTSARQFTIAGTAHTSHGEVTTRIDTSIAFSSAQQLLLAPNGTYRQDTVQNTSIDTVTTRTPDHGESVVVREQRLYPLVYNYDNPIFADGTCDFANQIDQAFSRKITVRQGSNHKRAALDNHRKSDAVRHYSGACFGSPYTPTVTSSQSYTYADPFGACYSRTITAASPPAPAVLIGVTDGVGCDDGENELRWHDRFADFASHLFGTTEKLLP